MDITKAVERVNSGESLASVGALFEPVLKRDAMRRRIEAAGYIKVNKQWIVDTQKNETTNERTSVPIKERSNVIRKRASFDIDVDLLKELKLYSVKEEKNAYVVVEDAIKQYLRDKDYLIFKN